MPSTYVSTSDLQNKYARALSDERRADPATAGSSANPLSKLTSDYSTFLRMLTTQLKNQDPLSPLDSNQFTQQLVSFSGVEQQISANDKLSKLINLQQGSSINTYLGFIGKEAEVAGDKLPLLGDSAKFSYELKDVSSSTTIKILDKDGQVVRTIQGEKKIGRHEFEWDGKDDGGTVLPKGTYTLSVEAANGDGSTKKLDTTVFGKITGVQSTANGVVLVSGDVQMDLFGIISVRQV